MREVLGRASAEATFDNAHQNHLNCRERLAAHAEAIGSDQAASDGHNGDVQGADGATTGARSSACRRERRRGEY